MTCPSQKVGSTVGGAVGSRPIKSTGSLLKLVTDKGFGPSCRAGTAVAAAAAAIVHHQNTTCDTAAAHNAHCNVDHNTTSKLVSVPSRHLSRISDSIIENVQCCSSSLEMSILYKIKDSFCFLKCSLRTQKLFFFSHFLFIILVFQLLQIFCLHVMQALL